MQIGLLADHPDAVSTITRWYFDEWSHIAPEVTEAWLFQRIKEKAMNSHALPLALVAYDDEELVGVVELKIRENTHYPEYEHWLGGVYVARAHRKKGIASALFNAAKEKAQQLGISVLYLQCEQHNITLYRQHGFCVLHTAMHHRMTTTIMVWQA